MLLGIQLKGFGVDRIEESFNQYIRITQDSRAAALLCVAAALSDIADSTKGLKEVSLGHEICMGVRHGLFGAKAAPDVSIDGADFANSVAEAIREHAG